MPNLSYYRRQIKKLEAKLIANADLCNELEVKRINKEIANYEKFIRQNEPKGVDSYLS
ncbi:hypothetical protein [Pseudoalteromonas phage SL25]|nr:hypothetical protein [Pseudoalteromonas phage SL25]